MTVLGVVDFHPGIDIWPSWVLWVTILEKQVTIHESWVTFLGMFGNHPRQLSPGPNFVTSAKVKVFRTSSPGRFPWGLYLLLLL